MNTRTPYILWSVLILASYAVLYALRTFDGNVLFNWEKIFGTGVPEIFLLFIPCLLFSYAISDRKFEIKKWDVPILFFGAFLLGAVFWSAPEIHPDAGRYFAEARYLEEYGALSFVRDWGVELNVMSDFPVVPFIYGLIFRFVGESRTYIQIFATSLFALTCVLTYLIGKRLWNRDTGIYAALFLVSSPYLLSYKFTLPTIPLTFFLTAAVYATLNALDPLRGKIWTAASAVFIVLTIMSKTSGVLFLVVVPAIFLVSYLKTRDRRVLYNSASIALLSGAFIVLFVFYKFDVLVGTFSLLKAYKLRMAESYETSLSLLFFQISPLVTLLALSSFNRKNLNLKYLLLLVWFLVPFVLMYDTRIRYTAPALPAIAIMASLGLGKIRSGSGRRFLASGIILCSIVVAVFGYLPFMHAQSEMNVKRAAEYADTMESRTIEVYAVLSKGYQYDYYEMEYRHRHTRDMLIPIFDLYSGKEIATPEYRQRRKPPRTDWTWQYNYPPPYYSRQPSNRNAIVIITKTQRIPESLEERLRDNYVLVNVYGKREFDRPGEYVVEVYTPVAFIYTLATMSDK